MLATTSQTYVSLAVCRHSLGDCTLLAYIMGKEARARHNFLPSADTISSWDSVQRMEVEEQEEKEPFSESECKKQT